MTHTGPDRGPHLDPLPVPPSHPHRLVFLGTPEIAVAPLVALHAAGFDIALVVTGADKRRGRGRTTSPTPVKLAGVDLGLAVSHDLDDVPGTGADLGVVVAYGRILRRPLLEALPMMNLHFSLLPRWRGAAPVERAILGGDDRTGVCVMAVEEGLDTGGVYASAEVAIDPSSTAEELGAALTEIGSGLLVETLQEGLADPEPQAGEATYAAKITSEDLRLDWYRPAVELDRIVRVGGAWTTFRGQRLKVLRAQPLVGDDGGGPAAGASPGQLVDGGVVTGDGLLRLEAVQPAGKSPVAFADWVNGAHLAPSELLGEEP